MNVAIFIEEDQLDLFQDETIEITSSVQNVNDITKNTLDYSKNFTVPASENNNKIFKHYYNPDIDFGFDARTRVNGRIEINGVVFKYGKLSLLSVKLKQNKPSSYSLVFYGNAISLADKLGSDELSVLDLSAYNHAYNDVNVKEGLTRRLFSGDIKYPLIAKKRYYYNSSVTNDGFQSITNHSNITNVSWANGVDWKELRASIKIIRIIEAIESKYGFTFSRDFFGRSEFNELYLWLDNEKQKEISTEVEVDFDNTDNIYGNTNPNGIYPDFYENYVNVDLVNNNYIFTNQRLETGLGTALIFIYIDITPSVGYESVPYQILEYYDNELGVDRGLGSGYRQVQTGNPTDKKVSFRIKSFEDFKFKGRLRITVNGSTSALYNKYTSYFAEQTINVNFTIENQLPKLKIIDFLKGLFNMFKLVFYQNKESDPIYVNTLKDYYAGASLFDISPFFSTKEYDVERGKLLNEIVFKYEDPQTILNKQFKENTSLGYGDAELILRENLVDPNSPKLEGEKEEIKLPFEQVLYENLTDTNPSVNQQIGIQVGACIDDKYEPVNVKPLIHYIVNSNVNLLSASQIRFRNNNGTYTILNENINMPSHTIDFTNIPAYSLVFDREQNTFTNIFIENTLYTNYHQDYIASIFNSKRRNFKFEAKLPLRIILNLGLDDVLKIRENYFRINTWTYNLLTGVCKLDLINSFDNTINGFNASRTIINTDGAAKTESIFVTNFTSVIFDYVATWITNVYNIGNNIYFDLDANDTGLDRSAIVTITNTETLAEIEITINQTYNTITFGNTIILFGDTNITFAS